ncbi:DUF1684 domain-containing protein [Streptomyces sp. NPDC059578]|uniref:DUF1684 domain-containing protein n=1 Tax=unclassified Streptomyces TaxID=2593676 RepID=UPI003669FBE9
MGDRNRRAGTADAEQEWKRWHAQRTETIAGPYGPLALRGTHWLSDHPEGLVPAIPGRWTTAADGSAVVLTATGEEGLFLDGRSFAGEVRLTADTGGPGAARVALGGRRFVVLAREGLWAVRDFDPASALRAEFRGIDAAPYADRWSVPGRFTPYAGDRRSVQVENVDGHRRGLALDGELAFDFDGTEHVLRVGIEPGGSLWAVFADATSGNAPEEGGSYRFRFLRPRAPDAEGRTTVDFNRALLPPCAFADHFLCPFPPPGNTLPLAIVAGERNPVGH